MSELRAAGVSAAAVLQQLPPGSALIELVAFRPFNARARSLHARWGAPRYAAYVLTARGSRSLDLGEVTAIDAAVFAFRAQLAEPGRTDVERSGAALSPRVLRPLEHALAGAGVA